MSKKVKKVKNVPIWKNIYNTFVSQGLLEAESGDEFVLISRDGKESAATIGALESNCDLFVYQIHGIRVFRKEPKLLNRIRHDLCTFFGEQEYFTYSNKYYAWYRNPRVFALNSKCRVDNEDGNPYKIIDCCLRYNLDGDKYGYMRFSAENGDADYMLCRNYVCKVIMQSDKSKYYYDNSYFWMDRVF